MNLTLHIGVAETTINPQLGMQLDGNIGAYRPAQMVLNDLHARAIVFQKGNKRFLLLSMDLLAITQPWTDAIRDFAAKALGFDPDAVAVHVLQNHSSPSMGQIMLSDRLDATRKYPWIRGSDPAYAPMVLERLKPMIRQAAEHVQPVRLVFGSALENRVSFNRRIAMRDGTSEMGLGPDPQNVLYREGVSDPEVGVALFTTPELKTLAALLHHTCHPVHWFPHNAVHSDWPGAWAREVRSRMFPGVIPLVLNGCCGNMIHGDALNPHREDTPESMARLLTDAVQTAMTNPIFSQDDPVLDWRTVRFGIPYRPFAPEVFANAHKLIDAHPEPIWKDAEHTRFEWDWHFAASLLDLEETMQQHKEFEYEIQALRVGDLAILILPGEPFVEAQLQIKQLSPAKRTFVAHMSNRYVGYIPTPEAIRRGGYETRASVGSKLAPEALQMITEKSVELLRAMYA